jgi:hypothetical protein
MAEREPGQPESVDGSGPFERAAGATSFLQRAVIRRRVRFLRRRRELALHDLGGFLFESHRLGQPRDDLLTEKLAALTALDDELALLQQSLALREELAVLREPGIAACSHCAAIRDSAANFCPNCGRPAASARRGQPEIAAAAIAAPAAVSDDTAVQPPTAATHLTAVAAPAGVGDDTAVQAPAAVTGDPAVPVARSDDTAAQATADAVAQSATPGGEPSASAVDGPL